MALAQEQMNELIKHAYALEVGATLPIGIPPEENINTASRYIHQAFQGLPDRKNFRISTRPDIHSIWVTRKNPTRGLALGLPSPPGSSRGIPQGPGVINPANPGSFPQQIGNVPKAWKAYLFAQADKRKLEGTGNPEERLFPLLADLNEGKEVTLILDSSSTDLWIALGILSVEYHVPPRSKEEILHEKQAMALRLDPFGAMTGSPTTKKNSSTDSNNETVLDDSKNQEQSDEEYREEMAEIFGDEGGDD